MWFTPFTSTFKKKKVTGSVKFVGASPGVILRDKIELPVPLVELSGNSGLLGLKRIALSLREEALLEVLWTASKTNEFRMAVAIEVLVIVEANINPEPSSSGIAEIWELGNLPLTISFSSTNIATLGLTRVTEIVSPVSLSTASSVSNVVKRSKLLTNL